MLDIGMEVLGQDNIMNFEEELQTINRRTEETLSILIEHFKETEERMDVLEKKLESVKCKCRNDKET
jgi:tetrahydromethanopterin S-methyltransferase subunit G